MKKFLISTFTASFLFSTLILSQVSPKDKGLQAITADAIRGQLEFLSSDRMEGRATGEKGTYLAADYIASMFKVFGAAPAGDAAGFGGRIPRMVPATPPVAQTPAPGARQSTPQKSYFQNFTLIESQEAPTGGSDYTAFTENKIPVIAWMAAMHSDYHQPSDEASLVNWNKMLDIIKLGYLQLWEAANGEIK